MKVLFLTLNVFSSTGGIEKVCRILSKAIAELTGGTQEHLKVFSMHDHEKEFNNNYFSYSLYTPFKSNKIHFVTRSIIEGIKSDIIILSHINLLIIGWTIKKISGKKKLVLLAHGIEIWDELPLWKKRLLKEFDQVVAVSRYTKDVVVGVQKVDERRCTVLNNCIDPFLKLPEKKLKKPTLLKRYNLDKYDIILLTLSRLSSHDRDKGYQKVLRALKDLVLVFPALKYLIIGKYQEAEKVWLENLIHSFGLTDKVVMTGYIGDEELSDHFGLSDIYVMPSTKEGFGIIFIEALFYGLPVIAGNKDGSVDALNNGEFGVLVDPDNQAEVTEAIRKVIADKESYIPEHKKVIDKFGFAAYKVKVQEILNTN